MPLEKVSKSTPLSKQEFHARLRAWLHSADNPGDSRIDGGATKYGGSAWLYVQDGWALYRLNADTKHQGVNDYLRLVDRYGDDLAWTTKPNRDGKNNAVAYGPTSEPVRRFYLYRDC